ncbi:hypothetical protein MNEG_14863 [Monoraphidium neglectum]|uniref:Protein kinase domain-containing protein n=1 Tax=Monoraphidium neglectum TaxID=145388 RepID=A0A0D2MD05_9CHLO|nr:hypothetical protein MNEG_14863 [Monoraphidium neglectum]KIY93100.1 hypothetical protein MNEG_14863 [Monoraphidium neglectum]|eukprot:XP_013892120.1 hypothetical protein MNEG_14863 [Monoraphidium neglectum]
MLFDDLTQSAAVRGHKRPAATSSFSGSFTLVQRIQAAGGLLRTNIPMKSTILRIALANKKQVLIPDVQKLINQLGAVNTDLFASRHVRPPTSVLLLPLRASGAGIYGALYCLSDVQTEFSEVSGYLKEVADLVGGGLMRCLLGELKQEYEDGGRRPGAAVAAFKLGAGDSARRRHLARLRTLCWSAHYLDARVPQAVQQLSEDGLMSPDRTEGSHSGPLGSGTQGGGASSGGAAPGGGGSSPSQAGQAGAQGPTGGNGAAGTPVHSGSGFVPAGAPRALAGHRSEVFELGSTVSTMGGSLISTGGSFSGGVANGRSFTARQMASSTGALVTGLTEKLNQRRLEAAMQDTEGGNLRDLQLTAQIGEGGFARVFRGLWRGQVVAVKVVASGEPGNERSVMKNAHEIAILSALSHPNILQAYTCLTDVLVRDVLATCIRLPNQQSRAELAGCLTAGGANGCGPSEDAGCHIEVRGAPQGGVRWR